jgi:hypothetical protein
MSFLVFCRNRLAWDLTMNGISPESEILQDGLASIANQTDINRASQLQQHWQDQLQRVYTIAMKACNRLACLNTMKE